jgi:lipoprotein-releasing system permease protein
MDPAREQFTGIVPGIGLASFRDSSGIDRFLVLPGDDVKITFPTAGTPPKAVSDTFTIVDYYESKMSEYDSNFVFVPIASLQKMRGMVDPQTGLTSVNSIQIRLREGADLDAVRDQLRRAFPADMYSVATWRDKQGPLLSAVDMEMAVLNILLFLIIAVAGFGILAIFFMIVVEKTRDIGILKSLGAGAAGIAGIFLGYGLFLGMVGAGAGLGLGLAIAWNINRIRAGVEWFTGERVFDPSIYYFFKIPTIVDPPTVAWIIVGAVGIAVASSVLPALRAARLHPVEALRHE